MPNHFVGFLPARKELFFCFNFIHLFCQNLPLFLSQVVLFFLQIDAYYGRHELRLSLNNLISSSNFSPLSLFIFSIYSSSVSFLLSQLQPTTQHLPSRDTLKLPTSQQQSFLFIFFQITCLLNRVKKPHNNHHIHAHTHNLSTNLFSQSPTQFLSFILIAE